MKAFDISVILNNALHNALGYVSKEDNSYIPIRSYRRQNAYMIEVCNSFTGSLSLDAESGLPMTSKEKNENTENKIMRDIITEVIRTKQ